MRKISVFIFFILFLNVIVSFNQEDLGKKYYESAMAYMQAGNFIQAIADLQSIVKSLPDSAYADEALLELGKYYMEQENDKKNAELYFSMLKEKYIKTENGPGGYYYLGKVGLFFGATQEELNNAYANFERIPLLFPKSKWTQQALYESGTTQRYLGQPLKASALLNQAIEKFPGTLYTDQAKLELAICYLQLNQPSIALRYVQQVIDHPMDPAVNAMAKNYFGFVYRYGFRDKIVPQPLFQLDTRFNLTMKLKNPIQFFFENHKNNFYLLDEDQKNITIMNSTGKISDTKYEENPQFFFFNYKGDLFIANKKNISTPQGKQVSFAFTYELKTKFINSIKEAAVDSDGNYYIIDRDYKGLFKFNDKAEEIEFPLHKTNEKFKKIFIDKRERIFLLSDNNKTIKIHKITGELLTSFFSFHTTNFKDIKDFALDAYDNLYVFDKELNTMFVFDNLFNPLAQFTFPQDTDPVAFTVGNEGEIYIINKKIKTVQLFR